MAHILIIEDEPTIAMVLQEVLADEGHVAVTAPDGPSGLQKLVRRPLPDLVLVDLFMPGMSGRAVIEVMRGQASLRDIPVIIVTGAVPGAAEFPPAWAYQAVIAKPFDVADVVSAINDLVRHRPSG